MLRSKGRIASGLLYAKAGLLRAGANILAQKAAALDKAAQAIPAMKASLIRKLQSLVRKAYPVQLVVVAHFDDLIYFFRKETREVVDMEVEEGVATAAAEEEGREEEKEEEEGTDMEEVGEVVAPMAHLPPLMVPHPHRRTEPQVPGTARQKPLQSPQDTVHHRRRPSAQDTARRKRRL